MASVAIYLTCLDVFFRSSRARFLFAFEIIDIWENGYALTCEMYLEYAIPLSVTKIWITSPFAVFLKYGQLDFSRFVWILSERRRAQRTKLRGWKGLS